MYIWFVYNSSITYYFYFNYYYYCAVKFYLYISKYFIIFTSRIYKFSILFYNFMMKINYFFYRSVFIGYNYRLSPDIEFLGYFQLSYYFIYPSPLSIWNLSVVLSHPQSKQDNQTRGGGVYIHLEIDLTIV